jgi:hypothetical protein
LSGFLDGIVDYPAVVDALPVVVAELLGAGGEETLAVDGGFSGLGIEAVDGVARGEHLEAAGGAGGRGILGVADDHGQPQERGQKPGEFGFHGTMLALRALKSRD